MRIIAVLLVALLVAAGGAWVYAGRASAPIIQIAQPTKFVGVDSTLDVAVEAPAGTLTRLDITLEQNGKSTPLYSMANPAAAEMKQETPERVRVTRAIGKRALADLQAGAGKIVVTAARKGPWGLRTREASASREFQARFTPPRVSVVSMHHHINFGGSEAVVYRATPPDVESGVQVGDRLYPGVPVANAGVPGADPSLRIALFGLLWEQDLNTPIRLYARDEAGNRTSASFDYKVFPRTFQKSRINLDDAFLQRVVPEILEHSPEINAPLSKPEDYLSAYLTVNNDLRRKNAEKIVSVAATSEPRMLWKGPFIPLGNASVEAKFADHRFYIYKGQEVDQQTHLGFDLAVTANIPVQAGNDGKVVYADYLGIYGNCVIIDHGMGLSSLYAHLASIDVKAGDPVTRGHIVGRSGMTGLAGGDHLHFSIQLQGQPVNPVEWWDPHWIEDRVMRKLREAGGGTPQ